MTKGKTGQTIQPMLPWPLCALATRKRVQGSVGGTKEAPRPRGVRGAEPRKPPKTGGSCARVGGGTPLRDEICPSRDWDWRRALSGSFRSGAASAGVGGGSGASLEGGRQGRPAGGARGSDSAPPALPVGPQPPSTSPSPEPERDWWWLLSLGGGRAAVLRGSPRRHRRPYSSAGRSDCQGNRFLAMGSGAATDPGCGKVSQTHVFRRAAAGHP